MSYGNIEKVEAISGLRRTAPFGEAAPFPVKTEEPFPQNAKPARSEPEMQAEKQNLQAALTQTYVRFIIDKDTHQVRVQVLNSANDEVIREIPPEDLVKIAADLRAYNRSVVDQRG